MNQQQPQGQPKIPYNPNQQMQGNFPPAYGQQPQGPGQQWNAAPNFNRQGQPGQAPQNTGDPGKKKTKAVKKKKGGSLIGWIFLGILLMIALGIGGGFLGYKMAINARQAEYSRKSKMAAAEQYQMALADIEQGKYANAKTRLDYVIEVDQNYPGGFELLQQVQLALYPTASPTPLITATPEPTPTKDNRGNEELFQSIQQAMYSQNWEGAIKQINVLRDRDISYRGLEVDGMYYIALRNFGIQQINNGYLENGVYNISLAEALGPIDSYTDGMRTAARAYLSGAGFWEINWPKALEYYSNAAMTYPNLFDRATMLTANQRYAKASFEVANLYIISEDYCGAIPYLNQGLPIAGTEPMQMTATAVYLECYPPMEPEVPAGSGETGTGEPGNGEPGYSEEYLEPAPQDFYFAG